MGFISKIKQMSNLKKLLVFGGIVVIALALALCVQKPEEVTPTPAQPEKELKLSDFPEVFKENTLIVIGDKASEIEIQAVNEIADYLENETGNKPLVKKYSEIAEEDKKNNLIIVGTPKTNPFLEEVYRITNEVQEGEYPSDGVLLQILRNVWHHANLLLVVFGSNSELVEDGKKELFEVSDVQCDTVIIGTIKMPLSSVSPALERCIRPAPIISIDNKTFYLKNICPY